MTPEEHRLYMKGYNAKQREDRDAAAKLRVYWERRGHKIATENAVNVIQHWPSTVDRRDDLVDTIRALKPEAGGGR